MRIHHRNLASFIGYCDDADNLALIYEYMANGNLKHYLSGKLIYITLSLAKPAILNLVNIRVENIILMSHFMVADKSSRMTWKLRLRIAIDAAQG